MTIEFAEFDDVLEICQNMRAADASEIYNVRHEMRAIPESIAMDVMNLKKIGGLAFVVKKDGEPIACVGASELWKGMFSVYMFATDRFDEVSLEMTRFIKKSLIPLVWGLGCRRAECMSAMSHTGAHEWLKVLGAKIEGTKRQYGATGEDYLCFTWIKGED